MEFLSSNTHIGYSQKIFEVGECAILEGSSRSGVSEIEKLACVSIHSKAAFSEIKAVLDFPLITDTEKRSRDLWFFSYLAMALTLTIC
jgi:phenylalanyl-tRNA synthetase beta subunit